MADDDSVGDAIGDDSMSPSDSDASFGDDGVGGDGGSSDGGSDSGGGFGDGRGGNENPNALLSSEDVLTRGRELALQGVPLQLSNLFEALAQLRARATGSTAEIFPAIIGQLSQLREQYSGASQAIARRLGFAGGGQVKREQGKALAGAARQYGGLIAGDQQASFANLINTLSGLQPALSGAARPPNVSTRDMPVDMSAQGAGIANMISAARRIEQFYNRNQRTQASASAFPGGQSTNMNQLEILQ